MADKRTAKSCYESRHGGNWITASQRITEIICERSAAFRGESLPTRFWQLDSWKKFFLYQKRLADGLLRIYSAEALLKALQSEKGKNIRSLAPAWVDQYFKQETAKIDARNARVEEFEVIETGNVNEKPGLPVSNSKKSIRGKLSNGKKKEDRSGGSRDEESNKEEESSF